MIVFSKLYPRDNLLVGLDSTYHLISTCPAEKALNINQKNIMNMAVNKKQYYHWMQFYILAKIIPLERVYWLCCSKLLASTLLIYFLAAEEMTSPIPPPFSVCDSTLGGQATALVTKVYYNFSVQVYSNYNYFLSI